MAVTPTATVGENELVSGLDPNLTYEDQPKPANTENDFAAPTSGWITILTGTAELKLAAGTNLLRVKQIKIVACLLLQFRKWLFLKRLHRLPHLWLPHRRW